MSQTAVLLQAVGLIGNIKIRCGRGLMETETAGGHAQLHRHSKDEQRKERENWRNEQNE